MNLALQDYRVNIEVFEGPLDLLLFLIRKNELDIYDIPISFITEQYLAYIDMMQELDVELVSEFLVIAATLLEIKARMLIPTQDEDEKNPDDQRQELINRLLEHQLFKDAAIRLNDVTMLYRDAFPKGINEEIVPDDVPLNIEADIYDLFVAYRSLIDRAPKEQIAYMTVEKVNVAQRINDIIEFMTLAKSATIESLLPEDFTRMDLIITILAILELLRLRILRCEQKEPFGSVWVYITS
ncbi:MAG: segregation/condensation protein A [Deltaproteobacteria bacterium]|nr:segregation/condensation protein A [Deltaproteobacteria bacterium]MCL5791547.1 segregation/condensation protein A [Deltaproteobacteria bacterium]